MNRFICIHGHFYQPPRENAWLEEVESQDSAYPFHDWNERISAECYAPNMSARILNEESRIEQIINNYSRISFNFGPTLLTWMERHDPDVYAAIIEADRLSRTRYGGHGSAIAQVYNHIIMPLASARDKRTQIIWGIEDFRYRFGRDPEGMWLAETAVDMETLELLAEHGIAFTILAPRQADKFRKIGERKWADAGDGKIDSRQAYRCQLSGNRSIALFFYDGEISQDIAFGSLLNDGLTFAERLAGVFDDDNEDGQLSHIATDGETYGHHHHHGDMALAYCLDHIERQKLGELTIYGDYLEKWPPMYEVRIFDDSSWSCVHGIERWRSDCGCNSGGRPSWQQEWRGPLRLAFDWLRDTLTPLYADHASELLRDPWAARDDYIAFVRDRSEISLHRFFDMHATRTLSAEDTVRALKLLEMQRHCMLMYTSCAWFFDEISGIETVQVLQYAARAMQLAQDVIGAKLESSFINILGYAPSNRSDLQNGAGVYDRFIRPGILELDRVASHFAMISLFEQQHGSDRAYCYRVDESNVDREISGRQSLRVGEIAVQSVVTLEQKTFWFTAVHLGDIDIIAGVRPVDAEESFDDYKHSLMGLFSRRDMTEVRSLMTEFFGERRYSLRHVFRDDRRRILRQLVDSSVREVDVLFRQVYQSHLSLIQAIEESGMPLPRALATTADFVCNADLRQALEKDDINERAIDRAIDDARRHRVSIDSVTLGFIVSRRVAELSRRLKSAPYDHDTLDIIRVLIWAGKQLDLSMNLWEAQNIFFQLKKSTYAPEQVNDRTRVKQETAELIETLVDLLQLRTS